jgi:hypothetical protein
VSSKPTFRKGGRASIESSFENDNNILSMHERQKVAKKIKEASQI